MNAQPLIASRRLPQARREATATLPGVVPGSQGGGRSPEGTPRWTGSEPPVRATTDDLVSAYPTHVPMGLPHPVQTPDRPDEEYSL